MPSEGGTERRRNVRANDSDHILKAAIALSMTLATISAPTPQVTQLSSAATRRAVFFTDARMESV